MRDVSSLLAFHRERFVGRERELAFVAERASAPEPGYLLVEAPGGFGKSTLLAQVVDRVAGGRWPPPVPALACFFVRADGARNTAAAFLAAVNAQLLGLLGLPGGTPPGIAELRTQFSELWSAAAQRATAQRPVLLVVDGLDEMADEDVSVADVLPEGLDPFVHVVVSSREVPDAREQVDRVHPLRAATAMSLPAFGLEGIRLMLERYGADVPEGAAERILAITGGEPLFARFVCEELGKRGVGELDRLEADPPDDAEDYFREQLRRLDEAELGEVSWQILGTLVVAYGGMTATELAGALRKPSRVLRPALRPVERFLLGEERLDIFHRALRELIAGEFLPAELDDLRRGILAWCAGYGKQGWPEGTPAYVLDHYAAHLAERDEATLVTLPGRAWMTRRRHASGSLGGFIADAELALGCASGTADQVRLCLVLASARSVATSAPAAAVGVFARLGYVTEARSYVELIDGPQRRARAFAELGAALHATGDAGGAHEAFTAAVEQLAAEEYKLDDFVDALEAVAVALGDAADVEALTRLLTVAESVEFDGERARSISAAAAALARAGADGPARGAIETAGNALLARAAAGAGRPPDDEDEDEEEREGIDAGAVGALAAAAGGLGLRDLLEALDAAAVAQEDLAGVAEGWARLGEERRALDVTARIAGDVADAVPVLRADCFAAVRRELAREALASLPPAHEWAYGFALEAAAGAAEAARDAEALAAAADAVTGDMDEAALIRIAAGWAALGRGPQALEALRRMPVGDGSYLDVAGPEIAAALARAGLFDDALAAAGVAVDPAARAAGIAAVARGRLDAGDEAGALADARRAVSEGETLAETGEAAAMAVLARAFARAGDAARAAEATERARAALEQILPGARSDGDARPVFEALMEAGRLDDARTVADGEYPDARRLARLALAHAQAGDRETALELAARVVELAESKAFGSEPVDIFFDVAATHAALGDAGAAGECIRRALAVDAVGLEVDLELHKIERLAAAGRAGEAAERARRMAGDPGTEPGPAAHALAAAGLADEAAPIARAAIEAWQPAGDPHSGDSYLLALAGLLPPDEAADRIRALRDDAGTIRQPYWRAGHLAALAAALHPHAPAEAGELALDALRAARLGGRRAFLMAVVVPALDAVAECAAVADLYDWIVEIGGWWAPE